MGDAPAMQSIREAPPDIEGHTAALGAEAWAHDIEGNVIGGQQPIGLGGALGLGGGGGGGGEGGGQGRREISTMVGHEAIVLGGAGEDDDDW